MESSVQIQLQSTRGNLNAISTHARLCLSSQNLMTYDNYGKGNGKESPSLMRNERLLFKTAKTLADGAHVRVQLREAEELTCSRRHAVHSVHRMIFRLTRHGLFKKSSTELKKIDLTILSNHSNKRLLTTARQLLTSVRATQRVSPARCAIPARSPEPSGTGRKHQPWSSSRPGKTPMGRPPRGRLGIHLLPWASLTPTLARHRGHLFPLSDVVLPKRSKPAQMHRPTARK